MSTEINEYLFTLRGRPVLFKRSEFCGELHATERGVCPFSPTGFRSLAGFARLPIDEHDTRHPTEIVTHNFLESIAAENDRKRESALREARKTARRCSRNRLPTPTSVSIDADDAMLYGYFATDAQRTELWQAAYLLYRELAESDNYTPDKLSATAHWDEDICHYWIEHVWGKLALLRQFMSGDFSQNIPIDLGCEYFNLPPKPGGEPVIVIPQSPPKCRSKLMNPNLTPSPRRRWMKRTMIKMTQMPVGKPNKCPSFDGKTKCKQHERPSCIMVLILAIYPKITGFI